MSRHSLIFLLHLLFFPYGQCISQKPPVIVEQPQDILAELDKPMALHCRAESDSLDDLRVNWYKDGRLVTMDPNARIITEFMALHVINSMPQDAGSYYCVAENSHGRTQSRTAKVQFIKLDKEFPIAPTSTSISLGERIRLRCEPPHGSPVPIVYWTKDGKNLTIPLDHYDLVLPSVQSSDFGAYRCIAYNGILRQSSVAHLTEFHRPKIHLRPSSSRIDLQLGQSIDFQCQVESVNDDDQYQIEWHYGNQHGPVLGRNARLDIASVGFNHSGIYICVVSWNNGRRRHIFSEQVFLAVHQRLRLSNNEEKIVSYGQINIHKNPINSLLQQSRQQQQQPQQLNPYATTGIFQQYHPSPPSVPTSATLLPSYSDSIRSPGVSHQYALEQQQQQNSVQYQPPWMDHPSTSFPYRSQPHTPYHSQQTYCVHCASQSHTHPHTPTSIRTTTHSPCIRPSNPIPIQTQPSPHIKTNADIRWPLENTINSSPMTKRQSHYAPPPSIPPPSNPMMINSLGGETMTTSWASSTDASHPQSVSSSSLTDKNEQRKILDKNNCSSSEGSIFSDSENAQDESNLSALLDHERRPTFLMPTV